MELRDYQSAMLDEARAHMRSGRKRILLRLATGGGKTVMAAEMLGGAAKRGKRSFFNVHRRELIDQTSLTFAEVGIDHGFVAAGMPYNPLASVVLAGVQTLANRLVDIKPPDLVVTDECHHCTASTWDTIAKAWPDAVQIGLTATPERLDGRGLSDHYDVMVDGPSTAELIERGYLSPFTYFAPGKPDLVRVPTRAGDFNRGELGAAMDKPKLIGDVVEHYLKLAAGKQGVVFAVSRDHSRHIAEAFAAAGVRAAHVDGAMADKERARIVSAFRAGDLDVMVNVDLFGEGFDVPGMVYAGLARPTKSLALFLQQVGRALRIAPGKERAIIADHAGNAFTHGLPDDPRDWSLEGRKKRAGRVGWDDATPIHQCPECFRVTASTVRECPGPGCGHLFVVASRSPEQEDGELSELGRLAIIDKKQAAEQRKAEHARCETLGDFIQLGEARGYEKPAGWARHMMQLRGQRYSGQRRRA